MKQAETEGGWKQRARSGDSNGWARWRRARYFRGFARGDTSIGVAILGRRTRARDLCGGRARVHRRRAARAGVAPLRRWRSPAPARGHADAAVRSASAGSSRKKFDRHAAALRRGARGRRRDYLTRGRTRRARAPRPVAAILRSSQQRRPPAATAASGRQCTTAPGAPAKVALSVLHARAHTPAVPAHTIAHPRVAPCITSLPRRPNPRGKPGRTGSQERRRVPPTSRAVPLRPAAF